MRHPIAYAACATLPALLAAGCIDFVEPDLPELGAPAIIETRLVHRPAQRIDVDARLAPGLDRAGTQRRLTRESLLVSGEQVEPDSVLRNGTRLYRGVVAADGGEDVIAFEAPVLDDVGAPPPSLTWPGLARPERDTLVHVRGGDLVLHVRGAAGAAEPPPQIRQWSLVLRSGVNRFTLGANGPPPDTLVIPRQFMPDAQGDSMQVTLIYQQSAQLRPPPGDYIGVVTMDSRIDWTVRVVAPAVSLHERP